MELQTIKVRERKGGKFTTQGFAGDGGGEPKQGIPPEIDTGKRWGNTTEAARYSIRPKGVYIAKQGGETMSEKLSRSHLRKRDEWPGGVGIMLLISGGRLKLRKGKKRVLTPPRRLNRTGTSQSAFRRLGQREV